ncbi:MAG: dTDP-4-dehydrorhamnose reductase [Lentisphaerae bacterium]|nr:dTDP-4-dehydrorhamnose reductase [Lentisphaerota bacterium]
MIWITGANGMLGSDLVPLLRDGGWDVLATDAEVDVRDSEALRVAVASKPIDWVINCCAYTAVDAAEANEAAAMAINVDGAAHVAEVATSLQARMIHISTDYVFDGQATHPRTEDEPRSPIGVYARSKAESEKRVAAAAPDSTILRTAWLYGHHGGNFVHTMLRLMEEREQISVVNDQFGSPTQTVTLCRVIRQIIRRDVHADGIYHVTSRGETSWYGFALAIRDLALERGLLSHPCEVKPIATVDYPTPARRPPYSVLSCAKIEGLLDIELPSWQSSLATFLTEAAELPKHTAVV